MCIRQSLYLEAPLAGEALNQLTCKKDGAQFIQPGDVLPAWTDVANPGWVVYVDRKMHVHLLGNNLINMYLVVYIMLHQKPSKGTTHGSPHILACEFFQ